MKHIIASFFLVLLIPIMVNAKAPRWVSKRPAAENDTYRYVVESASGNSEQAALNKAMGLVYQQAISALGLTISSTQVEKAISSGNFESMAMEFKIPVNKVCSYREKLSGGGIRVYVLCQVAVKSDRSQEPVFTEFRNCGKQGPEPSISGRPDEWGAYDNSNDYFSCSVEEELEKNQSEQNLRRSLKEEARKNLIGNLNIADKTADSNVISRIQTKEHFHQQSRTMYAIAFIKRDGVNNIYSDKVKELIDVCFHKMETAQCYIDEKSMENAEALLDEVKSKIDKEITPRFNFLRAYCDSRYIDYYQSDIQKLQSQLMEKKGKLRLGAVRSKKEKVQEFVRCAERSKFENKLADALRYYYGAQVLLNEMQDMSSVTIQPQQGDAAVNANNYIINSIKGILSNIKVSFDGFRAGSNREAKLSFIYNDQAVTNLSYTYNENSGWSGSLPVMNGWSIITLSGNNRSGSIHILIEYRYEDEAYFDPELKNVIAKHRFDYDKDATKIIEIRNITAPDDKPHTFKDNTNINQNIVADRVTGQEHKVLPADSSRYASIINKVCEGIDADRYDEIESYFTANGCEQLNKLLKYGKARVISMDNCRFIKMGNEVTCRSIPMSFTFSKGKKTFENVVFTFDANGKIDGIQFALEERSSRNIMYDNEYPEIVKLAIINFMENYKTAYALQRLDYINSIFADDAVIIVGRVLQNTNNIELDQTRINNVAYHKYTKQAYMKILENHFKTKEWINIKFSNTKVENSAQKNIYAIQLLQDYSSNNYGDRGYLFLLIDCSNPDAPLIKVRTWQPETAGENQMSLGEFNKLINRR